MMEGCLEGDKLDGGDLGELNRKFYSFNRTCHSMYIRSI